MKLWRILILAAAAAVVSYSVRETALLMLVFAITFAIFAVLAGLAWLTGAAIEYLVRGILRAATTGLKPSKLQIIRRKQSCG